VLLALRRAAADDAVQLGVHQDVGKPEALGGDAGALDHRREFLAGELVPAAQGADQQRGSLLQHLLVQSQLPVVVGVQRVDARRGERQHPADLGGQNEVPGRPQDVGPEDGPVREGPVEVGVADAGGALADRPFRRAVVL
jgi:hypothetical protein